MVSPWSVHGVPVVLPRLVHAWRVHDGSVVGSWKVRGAFIRLPCGFMVGS